MAAGPPPSTTRGSSLRSNRRRLLAESQSGPPPLPVVAPYLIDAKLVEGKVRPLTLREAIRAFGPTI